LNSLWKKYNKRLTNSWKPWNNERKPKRSTVNQNGVKLANKFETSKQIQSIQRRSFESLTAGRVRKKTQKAHGEPIGDTTVVIQLLTKDLIEKVAAHFQMLVSNTLARKNCQKGSQQTLNQHPPGPSNWEKKPKGGAKKK
jgi:hypothetical protein